MDKEVVSATHITKKEKKMSKVYSLQKAVRTNQQINRNMGKGYEYVIQKTERREGGRKGERKREANKDMERC